MCLRIPLFLDIFQLLGQTFSDVYICFVFLYDNWSKYLYLMIGLKNNH